MAKKPHESLVHRMKILLCLHLQLAGTSNQNTLLRSGVFGKNQIVRFDGLVGHETTSEPVILAFPVLSAEFRRRQRDEGLSLESFASHVSFLHVPSRRNVEGDGGDLDLAEALKNRIEGSADVASEGEAKDRVNENVVVLVHLFNGGHRFQDLDVDRGQLLQHVSEILRALGVEDRNRVAKVIQMTSRYESIASVVLRKWVRIGPMGISGSIRANSDVLPGPAMMRTRACLSSE